MVLDQVTNASWTRKHDEPGKPYHPSVPRIVYPKTLAELVEICADNSYGPLHAAGSHWALSDAAVSDTTFIETHDPTDNHQAMGTTLHEVIPGCMDLDLLDQLSHTRYDNLFVHVESGKRVYQLYSELDFMENAAADDPGCLRAELRRRGNTEYDGAWAFATLGGAGGQTIFGALTTGTHGGDLRLPPIADSVVAIHLVADGGKQYWIEPTYAVTDLHDGHYHLVNAGRLASHYGNLGPVEVIYDDTMFNAALVSVGRFGVVYSVVLKAVRQYSLREVRYLSNWQDIKGRIANPSDPLFSQRFLQIAVSLTPYAKFSRNLCGITQRDIPDGVMSTTGRAERRGDRSAAMDPLIQAYRFANAGNNFPYQAGSSGPSFLETACANADFLIGLLEAVAAEIDKFIKDHAIEAGGALAAITVLGGASALLSLISALAVLLGLLLAAIAAYKAITGGNVRFGTVLNDLRATLLGNPDPAMRMAGILIWQAIVYKAFQSQQAPEDFTAISYAVMDSHNYRMASCEVNVDSVELFFDADHTALIAFVDALLVFEATQEVTAGMAAVGYASLRFTGPSRALLGMERFPRSCAVEVACLRDVAGSQELVDFASAFARNHNIRGIVHWGQRNDCTRAEIQYRFGEKTWFGDSLTPWRDSLHRITDNGTFNRFSSAFTRRLGLE
jgi:hypothetical protein